MINKIKLLIKMIRINYSSYYASYIANEYWQNTEITHGSMNESNFDFYYKELLKLMRPKKNDMILDYGGGNGEIAFRFKINKFDIRHCDLSSKMVENAIEKYNLNSCECVKLDNSKYDKILFHNAFFYIHPSLFKSNLLEQYKRLHDGGSLYITDLPDFSKRHRLGYSKFYMNITNFFPIYQIELAGFFIKDDILENLSKEIGFKVKKYDSWCDCRSHFVLTKITNDN